MPSEAGERTRGLASATLIGVGAIVGGGVLALAGTAFASAGPAALVAFAANGLIALATAWSFAGMASAFPQSGGSYTFAKMVLSVRTAFAVGWVVWFASIAAGVLYAMGFAVYALIAIESIAGAVGFDLPAWTAGRPAVVALAAGAALFYAWTLLGSKGGGGNVETVGKVVVFVAFIAMGLWVWATSRGAGDPEPFFHRGGRGLAEAMGFTFIALQGFDLIAAVAGEIEDPRRNIPRAMFLSLGIALAIYLPLLFVVMTVGVGQGETIVSVSEGQPEAVIAIAGRRILGAPGFWLIVAAALLSMLSALQANLLAASRIAQAMARDRTLPWALGRPDPVRGTPTGGIVASVVLLVVILCLIPDLAAAGAAASLIFLVSFTLVHWTNHLARRRGALPPGGRLAWLPVAGGLACAALALFQGMTVPAAGLVAALWMALGGVIYATLFARRAEAVDAAAVARGENRAELRGLSPLVLLPIANPTHAASLVSVAQALAPPRVGRVLLLSVLRKPERSTDPTPPPALVESQAVLLEAQAASFASGLYPEALVTVAADPWPEIARVARTYRCRSLLLGMSRITDATTAGRLEQLMSAVDSDVVVLRASPGWQVSAARRIVVPVGGGAGQGELRARLLGSLARTADREIRYLRVLPVSASSAEARRVEERLSRIADEEASGSASIAVVRSDDPAAAVIEACAAADLAVLGLQRAARRRKAFGGFALRIAAGTDVALLLISRRG